MRIKVMFGFLPTDDVISLIALSFYNLWIKTSIRTSKSYNLQFNESIPLETLGQSRLLGIRKFFSVIFNNLKKKLLLFLIRCNDVVEFLYKSTASLSNIIDNL